MLRKLTLACAAFLAFLSTDTVVAQVSFNTTSLPSRRSLSRLNLEMQWNSVVPLAAAEKLTELSIDSGILFAQTNSGNFYAFDAESGRQMWSIHLSRVTTKAEPASVNSTMVFVTNSNTLFGIDKASGREVWNQRLPDSPSSATNADDRMVLVGLQSGKLVAFEAQSGKEIWNFQTNLTVTSRPLITSKVVALASEDKKVYLTKAEQAKLYWRFATGAPILAPLSSHGVRTLIAASTDNNVYAIDLFSGKNIWTFASGAAVKQEPLVADNDVYVVNEQGSLSSMDASTGTLKWTISTLGGRLLSVSKDRVYLESHDDDLFVVDRATGKFIYDPQTTYQRAGVNLREFVLGPTNRLDDRLYFGTSHGLLLCLRETMLTNPRMLRDPQLKPFGYVPPEGYQEADSPGTLSTPRTD